MRYQTHQQTLRNLRFLTVNPAILIAAGLCCLLFASPATAQTRDWRSRFLPQQQKTGSAGEDERLEQRERGRYYRNLVRDENAVRTEAERLVRLARSTQSYGSGAGDAAQQAAFSQLLRQVGAREGVAVVLQEEIPELDANSFVTEPFGNLVLPDGQLVEPPLRGALAAHFDEVQAAWNGLVEVLADEQTRAQDIAPFHEAVEQWNLSYRSTLDRSRADGPGLEAFTYMKQMEALMRVLGRARDRKELSAFLRDAGHPFPGGTVGDLVTHVVNRDITVCPGSDAHVVLSKLTQEMLFEAEADLAVLEDRIEFYKQQSLAYEGQSNGAVTPYNPRQTAENQRRLPRRNRQETDEPAEVRPASLPQVANRENGPRLDLEAFNGGE